MDDIIEKVKTSCNGKVWQQKPYNEGYVNELMQGLAISDFLARLIATRTESALAAHKYLNPKIKNQLPDPFHLLDMDKAVSRTISAIDKKEKICIFADYDVDGATSSALIKNILSELNIDAEIYVPDRIAEGYGPSKEAMKKIYDNGAKLIITVDCGAVAFEALEYAAELGLDVVVLDHHISLEKLPTAVAIVNPNRLDETSEYGYLAAVGVSFLYLVALIKILKEDKFFEKNNIPIPDLMGQLDIVALGTVCDVMPLVGLNRVFVTQGLKIAKNRKNIGYSILSDVASVSGDFNVYHLGFVLGPRINAGGRVGKADLGARLLSSKSEAESLAIAKELDMYNEERKVIELNMLEQAYVMAESQYDDAIIFVVGKNWHPGVIGIVAGRLKEKYNKPVAVIALKDGEGKASCRSIKGIDFGCKIIEAKQKNLLVAGGGHAMAAGFTVEESKIEQLKVFLNIEIAKDIKKSSEHLKEYYDLELSLSAINLSLAKQIQKLSPMGNGNNSPIFKISNIYACKVEILKDKHIKCLLVSALDYSKHKPISAIIFNAINTKIGEFLLSDKRKKIDIFVDLKINSWNGLESVQLHPKDIIVH